VRRDFDRVLRWYPAEWRARYGAEMEGLLEDTYGSASSVPRKVQFDLARSGLTERARAVGVIDAGLGAAERRRDGSLLVLVGWALFALAGACFGKFSDNWFAGTPATPSRSFSTASYGTLFVAEVAGCALVVGAALACLPSLLRLVRGGGWPGIRRPALAATLSVVVCGAVVVETSIWAHQLTPHQRNGGSLAYSLDFVLLNLVGVAAVTLVTVSVWSVTRHLELSGRLVDHLVVLSRAVTILMLVVLAAFVGWWVAEAVLAPDVLASGISDHLALAPPMMLTAGILMLSGLRVAGAGVARIRRPVTV
jgi:hypothetical protein